MNYFLHKYKQVKGIIFFSYLNIFTKLRILTNRDIYHVIGDSHTTCFLHPAFIIHHVGPATAYRLNYDESTTKSRKKVLKILSTLYKQKELNVIFVFGELDVRIHINKIANEKNLSINSVIRSTVESYFKFLKYVKNKYPLINVYTFNVPPQGEEENIYNYPYYASRDKRMAIAAAVNNKLKTYSKRNNFKFIDVYSKLIDKNGNRKREYVFDDIHYNRKIMQFVIKELNTI